MRSPKPPKDDSRAHKKMRMTELEKLKKNSENPKKQRSLRGSKDKAGKVADIKTNEGDIDSQHTAKGKKKKNVADVVSEPA